MAPALVGMERNKINIIELRNLSTLVTHRYYFGHTHVKYYDILALEIRLVVFPKLSLCQATVSATVKPYGRKMWSFKPMPSGAGPVPVVGDPAIRVSGLGKIGGLADASGSQGRFHSEKIMKLRTKYLTNFVLCFCIVYFYKLLLRLGINDCRYECKVYFII